MKKLTNRFKQSLFGKTLWKNMERTLEVTYKYVPKKWKEKGAFSMWWIGPTIFVLSLAMPFIVIWTSVEVLVKMFKEEVK